jgi:hypothetical protein
MGRFFSHDDDEDDDAERDLRIPRKSKQMLRISFWDRCYKTFIVTSNVCNFLLGQVNEKLNKTITIK